MRIRYWIMILLIATGLSAAVYAYREFNRGPVNLSKATPEFITEASDILSDFERDENLASKRYNGKIIRLRGFVKSIEQEKAGASVVLLAGGSDGLSAIRCSMDTTWPVPDIKAGGSVELTGICIGFNRNDILGSDLILNRGIIEKIKN